KRSSPEIAVLCDRFAAFSPAGAEVVLSGPTGERNEYKVLPRTKVLCIANEDRDLLSQLAAALSVGARVVWPAVDRPQRLARALPPAISRSIDLGSDWKAAGFDV